MKQNILILFISCMVQITYAQKSMKYDIERTDYTKGTYKIFAFKLRNDSIHVTKFSTNNLPEKLLYSDVLNEKQKSELYSILKSIDLQKMKTEYINKNVEGEVHLVYNITINEKFKSIYVYFVNETNLKKLDDFIYGLLPLNQDGWYDVY